MLRSRVFPGLWLDTGALLAGNGAQIMATLREGLQPAEHATFVAALETRARTITPTPPAA